MTWFILFFWGGLADLKFGHYKIQDPQRNCGVWSTRPGKPKMPA
jgi:hypothetical protein